MEQVWDLSGYLWKYTVSSTKTQTFLIIHVGAGRSEAKQEKNKKKKKTPRKIPTANVHKAGTVKSQLLGLIIQHSIANYASKKQQQKKPQTLSSIWLINSDGRDPVNTQLTFEAVLN